MSSASMACQLKALLFLRLWSLLPIAYLQAVSSAQQLPDTLNKTPTVLSGKVGSGFCVAREA
jgi:hypothetical protein